MSLAAFGIPTAALLLLEPAEGVLPTELVPLALALLAVSAAVLMHYSHPPAVLFLTRSSPRAGKLFNQISLAIFPLRAVTLLEPRQMEVGALWFWMDNLRTSNPTIWKSVVNQLIEITPLVVIDTTGPAAAVARETAFVLAPERARKALFLTDYLGRYPALAANGIDPSIYALRLMDSDELINELSQYSRGRGSLPWPADLPATPPHEAITPETWETLPSVLLVDHPYAFDSVNLIETAIGSAKEILEVAGPMTMITEEAVQYLLELTWEFVHDPRHAAVRVLSIQLFVVRIAFLDTFRSELLPVSALGHSGLLTIDLLNVSDPIHTAMRKWARNVERVASAHGWHTREVIPPLRGRSSAR